MEKEKDYPMRSRSIAASISAGGILLVLTLFASATRTADRAQAMPAQQPAVTATVEARQTATAVTRATLAAQPQPPATPAADSAQSNLLVPENRGFNESRLSQISVPPGFWVNVFAQGLGNVRMLVAGPDGTLYATRREQGDVIALHDSDGDGRADQIKPIASDLPFINGIALHENQLYLATDRKVLVGDLEDDQTLSGLRTIIDDLPDAGQHPNRTLAIGPDGKLYITVGSTCNACKETNTKSATILRANPDGSEVEVFAKGLRNTIGFGWQPSSGQLWGFDHGSDGRGDNQPPEELNLLRPDGNYGWPYCFADRQPDPQFSQDPPGTTKESYCPTTLPPILTYQAHSAPIGMVFYTGAQFPQEYQGDAFVAMRGSWNRQPATGYKVVRVRFQNGWPIAIEDFMTGFLIENGAAHFGRLAGVAQAPYGSLFVAEDTNGVIYRVSWTGKS
jgi:glucose/arabinose dehydrogenase